MKHGSRPGGGFLYAGSLRGESSAGRMHQPQVRLGPGEAMAEAEVDPLVVSAAFDGVIAHLLGDGFDLPEVASGDPAREFPQPLVHENGHHADLDPLIEVFAAGWKTQPQAIIEMDVSHLGRPPNAFLAPFL